MRYLFGDSTPFPLDYNFLTTLDAFVTCAAKVVAVQAAGDRGVVEAVKAAAERERAVEDLERFHRDMMRAVAELRDRASGPITIDYVQKLRDRAAQIVDEHKRAAAQATEREKASAEEEVGQRRAEIRAALDTFLTTSRLPESGCRVTMRLEGGQNALSAVFTGTMGIVTAFRLTTAPVAAWHAPRKVGEIAQGVDLTIGLKKSWITRKVQPEVVRLDDHVIGGFEIDEDAAQLHLRKKPDLKDSITLSLHRHDGHVLAEVQRHEEEGPDGLRSPLDAGDRDQLDRLCQSLRDAVDSVLAHRERLLSVQLDGADVIEQGLVIPFVDRIVSMFAPIVRELAQRSPNALELTLKRESEEGRREEVYLCKADLVQRLEPLTPDLRALFVPLGLAEREGSSEDITIEV